MQRYALIYKLLSLKKNLKCLVYLADSWKFVFALSFIQRKHRVYEILRMPGCSWFFGTASKNSSHKEPRVFGLNRIVPCDIRLSLEQIRLLRFCLSFFSFGYLLPKGAAFRRQLKIMTASTIFCLCLKTRPYHIGSISRCMFHPQPTYPYELFIQFQHFQRKVRSFMESSVGDRVIAFVKAVKVLPQNIRFQFIPYYVSTKVILLQLTPISLK